MRPAFVQSGDTIALICTARWLSAEQCEAAVAAFAARGLRLVVGQHAQARAHQLAGTDDERTADLMWALTDPAIRGVIVGRGGYGTVRLLDALDMQAVERHTRWVVGFSDITALIAHLNSHGIPAIHGAMPVQFSQVTPASIEGLFHALMGEYQQLEWTGRHFGQWPINMAHRLLGGNLSVICSLLGSASFQPKEPYFLFIEEVDEMLYHVDRMLHALARSQAAGLLKGVLVGGMTQMKDNTKTFGFAEDNPWGRDVLGILEQWHLRFGFPIITGLPVGHQADNLPLYTGELAAVTSVSQGYWRMHWPEMDSVAQKMTSSGS